MNKQLLNAAFLQRQELNITDMEAYGIIEPGRIQKYHRWSSQVLPPGGGIDTFITWYYR